MLFTLQRYEFFSKSQLAHPYVDGSLGCCLPYKGTNFSANHNLAKSNFATNKMLFTLQRYEFFSKSQLRLNGILHHLDVVYPTKVRIFQQITTDTNLETQARKMLFTLQRYEFFSKSQQAGFNPSILTGCCLPYKGTNFSANHNF